MARYLVISADCHAGLPAPLYRPYLEQKYLGDFDRYLEKTAPGRGQGMKRLFTSEAIADHAKQAAEGMRATPTRLCSPSTASCRA